MRWRRGHRFACRSIVTYGDTIRIDGWAEAQASLLDRIESQHSARCKVCQYDMCLGRVSARFEVAESASKQDVRRPVVEEFELSLWIASHLA